jgi:hypothetical protein
MADTDATPQTPETEPREDETPPGRTSLANILLIVANVLALVGFAALLWADMLKRLEWAEAIFHRQIAINGIPLDDKDQEGREVALQIKHELDPPLLKEQYDKRGISVKDRFLPVSENFKDHVRYAEFDDRVAKRYFESSGTAEPVVRTLKEEVNRVRTRLPGDIEAVAKDLVDRRAKELKPDDKRARAREILFPLAMEGYQIPDLDKMIRATPDAKIDELLEKAAKRRMLFDILMPLEVFRPSELDDASKKPGERAAKLRLVNRLAKVNAKGDDFEVPYDEMLKLFDKRCGDVLADRDWNDPSVARDYAEKRRSIAFLLLTVADVVAPAAERAAPAKAEEPKKEEPKKPAPAEQPPGEGEAPKKAEQPEQKYPPDRPFRVFAFGDKGETRVEVVCGFRDFLQACEDLALVNDIMEKQTVEAVERDRGTYAYPLALRIYEPEKFADALVGLMAKMPFVTVPDAKGFRAALVESLKGIKGKVEGGDALVAEVRRVMDGQRVTITEVDPKFDVNSKFFDLEVAGLLNNHAVGFLGKYKMAVRRIEDLSRLIASQEQTNTELKALLDKRQALLADRGATEKVLLEKVQEARKETRRLALQLERLQKELYDAQVDLSGAHEYNVYLNNYLREAEQRMQAKQKTKGAKGP